MWQRNIPLFVILNLSLNNVDAFSASSINIDGAQQQQQQNKINPTIQTGPPPVHREERPMPRPFGSIQEQQQQRPDLFSTELISGGWWDSAGTHEGSVRTNAGFFQTYTDVAKEVSMNNDPLPTSSGHWWDDAGSHEKTVHTNEGNFQTYTDVARQVSNSPERYTNFPTTGGWWDHAGSHENSARNLNQGYFQTQTEVAKESVRTRTTADSNNWWDRPGSHEGSVQTNEGFFQTQTDVAKQVSKTDRFSYRGYGGR